MASVSFPIIVKMKARFDDLISPITGKRVFTNVLTDAAIDDAIRKAKAKRGGTSLPSPKRIAGAAKAYKIVKRIG